MPEKPTEPSHKDNEMSANPEAPAALENGSVLATLTSFFPWKKTPQKRATKRTRTTPSNLLTTWNDKRNLDTKFIAYEANTRNESDMPRKHTAAAVDRASPVSTDVETKNTTTGLRLISQKSSKTEPTRKRKHTQDFNQVPLDELLKRVDSVKLKARDPVTNDLVDLNENEHVVKQPLEDLLNRVKYSNNDQPSVSLVQRAGMIPSDCSVGTLRELHEHDVVYQREDSAHTDEEAIVVSDQDMGATPNVEYPLTRSSPGEFAILSRREFRGMSIESIIESATNESEVETTIGDKSEGVKGMEGREQAQEQSQGSEKTGYSEGAPPTEANHTEVNHTEANKAEANHAGELSQAYITKQVTTEHNPDNNGTDRYFSPHELNSQDNVAANTSHITITESEDEELFDDSALEICAVVPRFKDKPLVVIDDSICVIPDSEDEQDMCSPDQQSENQTADGTEEQAVELLEDQTDSQAEERAGERAQKGAKDQSEEIPADLPVDLPVDQPGHEADSQAKEHSALGNQKHTQNASPSATAETATTILETNTINDMYSSQNMSQLRQQFKDRGLNPGRSRLELIEVLRSVDEFNPSSDSKTDLFSKINRELTTSQHPPVKKLWTRMLVYEPIKSDELLEFFHTELRLLVDRDFVQEWADWSGVTLTHRA